MLPSTSDELLLRLVRRPHEWSKLPPNKWHSLLIRAQRARILARLAARLDSEDLWQEVPDRARRWFVAAMRIAEQHERMIRWEVDRLCDALQGVTQPVVLLKGAAYVMADLPVARGRLTSDVDILVPRSALDAVETAVLAHGWQPVKTDAYAQRYYRQYMHELPPLRHKDRATVLDIHHTIAPPTSRIRIDGARLWPAAQPLTIPGMFTLSPVDMVLHAVVHLFHDGDIGSGFRDLVDLGDLLQHFGGDEAFWRQLFDRATELGAGRPLYYALRYLQSLLGLTVPPAYIDQLERLRPPSAVLWLMDALVTRAIVPPPLEGRSRSQALADRLLYVRSHWVRMPPLLLARHLVHQGVDRVVHRSDG